MSRSKKGNKKWILWLALTVIILIIIVVFAKNNNKIETEVTTETAAKRTIIETVIANGKIQPKLDVKISPYISGEVVELSVREGDQVVKGQILARIDPTFYISALEQIEASLNSAKANIATNKARVAQAEASFVKAQADYKRNEKLYTEKVISEADWDAAKSTFEMAKADLESARENLKASEYQAVNTESSLKEARENLDRTNIYSPNEGTVSQLNIEVGERVQGASQFSSGTEIMRIANLNSMEVKVEVSETDITRVKLNDTCIIEVDAYLNRKFKGYVTEIATAANTTTISTDQVTNFNVLIMMMKESYEDLINEKNNISSPFRPGMSATVDIQTTKEIDILTVPIQSVTSREDTSSVHQTAVVRPSRKTETKIEKLNEYVFVLDGNQAKIKQVKTGIQDNAYIQIVEGLSEGDVVISGPYKVVSQTLRNGETVKVTNKK